MRRLAGGSFSFVIARLIFILRIREFLTGFHKRNLAKAGEKKKKAMERARLEHLERRREVGAAVFNYS
jgi:hypothetical protein